MVPGALQCFLTFSLPEKWRVKQGSKQACVDVGGVESEADGGVETSDIFVGSERLPRSAYKAPNSGPARCNLVGFHATHGQLQSLSTDRHLDTLFGHDSSRLHEDVVLLAKSAECDVGSKIKGLIDEPFCRVRAAGPHPLVRAQNTIMFVNSRLPKLDYDSITKGCQIATTWRISPPFCQSWRAAPCACPHKNVTQR